MDICWYEGRNIYIRVDDKMNHEQCEKRWSCDNAGTPVCDLRKNGCRWFDKKDKNETITTKKDKENNPS